MPVVPAQTPNQSQLVIPDAVTPYSGLWWTSQTITDIPEESVGWLVAQGWEITAVTKDESTTPATPWFSMSRQGMQNWLILQSLLNEYTVAKNDAKAYTEIRYNEVLANWTAMLASSQVHFVAEESEQSTHAALYLSNWATYQAALEQLVTDNQTAMDAAIATIDPLIVTATSTGSTHATAYDAIIAALPTDYTSYETLYEAVITLLSSDYDTYVTESEAVLDAILSDYTQHSLTAPGFLTDLGASELTRINEEFAATLSKQVQQAISNGSYSDGLLVDLTARNTRHKNDAIAALNDRLAREKLTNQHQLFEQQAQMRTRILGARDRLYEQKANMRGRTMEARSRLYEQEASMRDRTMRSMDQVYGLRQALIQYRVAQALGNAQALNANRDKAITELMAIYATHLQGMQTQHAETMKLMAYQLNERNNMLIGLYGFVERREDVGPRFEQLAAACTSLGDAGGGWVTP